MYCSGSHFTIAWLYGEKWVNQWESEATSGRDLTSSMDTLVPDDSEESGSIHGQSAQGKENLQWLPWGIDSRLPPTDPPPGTRLNPTREFTGAPRLGTKSLLPHHHPPPSTAPGRPATTPDLFPACRPPLGPSRQGCLTDTDPCLGLPGRGASAATRRDASSSLSHCRVLESERCAAIPNDMIPRTAGIGPLSARLL